MKLALISDIHGNLEALRAVLEDIRQQGIKDIWCLGDVIGYGPNPCECLDTVMRSCSLTILGNHDQAALFDPEGFNPVALQAIYWTRDQLDAVGARDQINARWDFLGELPRTHKVDDLLFVHGSPRDPTNEYVFPEDVYNLRKMEGLFSRFEGYCFQGHTHIPGMFPLEGDFRSPDELGGEVVLTGDKAMFNVGSVGQPRDSDPRGSYVILDKSEQRLIFRRVEYDFEATANKIYRVDQLDNMLGDRLKSGR
ncbi:MAG: phosphoesterase [Planctomycetaceae bacterium]|nr:phosphoesterase [Planctomycetaceae bacterium]HAA71021.1 phosphoesterase [Planctomycetaceae bacterium]